ncbi:MAG TPA: ATP-binding protein, partial [bacterium]
YNKKGRIEFSEDPGELYKTVDINDEQCIFCHASNEAIGAIPKENRFREIRTQEGERVLGLINPIENEPDCYTADCHAHSKDEKLLGLLDIKMSLSVVDKNATETRTKALIFSGLLVMLTTVAFGRVIRKRIQRPISKLIYGTRQVADLNLDYTIEINLDNEIGDLARSFNKMTKKLKQAQEELQEWSNTLEYKVTEKTKELEKAQKQLILAEKMASMGKLAAVVAHEINNPMSGILTYAKLCIKNLQNSPSPESINDSIANLKTIRDESKRCGDIVRNLLLFSKRSFGEKSKHDLKSIVDKSIELVRHSIEMKDMKLIKDFTNDDAALVCDPDAIQQMMIAILINAIEASPAKGGELKLGLQRSDSEQLFRLEIADNGVGIPEDVLPHIFEPFYSTKDSDKNTGLGLAVVYGIVERHGGSIDVQSQANRGTTFTINLPTNSV